MSFGRVIVCLVLSLLVTADLQICEGQGYSLQEAPGRMTMADGLTVSLFAGEPEVRQPIFCKCDERGRLWTIQYLQYPNPAGLKRVQVDRFSRTVYDRKPEPPPHGPRGADRITILEDTDQDGRADRFKDFVDGLNLCTGVEFGHGGVYVIQAPYLLFYPDRDRNDVPDSDPEVLLDGFGIEDAQSLANHLTWGPDGWLYGLNGSTTTCLIRGIEFQQGVWRYHPLTREFELFCEGGGNVYGLTFDRVGRLFYSSNGGVFYHGVQGACYEKNFGKHGPLHNPFAYGFLKSVPVNGQTGRPNTGATVYPGDSFPLPFRDAFLCGDFLTHTCSWWTVRQHGSTVRADLGGLWLDSHDTWFGATDLCAGPSGEMYVCDFHDARTAHPDPDAQWDTRNGRIYRVQAADAENRISPDFSRLSSTSLVELLGSTNGWYQQQARRQLAERRDATVGDSLRQMALQTENSEQALQGLWGCFVSGGFDESFAEQQLSHPDEHVRTWTIRFLGDSRTVSQRIGGRLIDLAQNEPSVIVRSQLASSARRLPGTQAIPVLYAMLKRGLDRDDPYIPWLLWWGIGEKTVSDRELLLDLFAEKECWSHPAMRDDLLRLIRRYASEGTTAGYTACIRLMEHAPADVQESIFRGLYQGLRERASGHAEKPADNLSALITRAWNAAPADILRLRLALETGSLEARQSLAAALNADLPVSQLKENLAVVSDYGDDTLAPAVLKLAVEHSDELVRLSALSALRRFADPLIAATLLKSYSTLPEAVKFGARDVLFGGVSSTLAFLQEVDAGRIVATSVPTDQLRSLALLRDAEVDALVRKHWGNLRPGTPEEKLADIRRFNNDLRAGTGNLDTGRLMFRKHCVACHRLDGEGIAIGPDITGTVKGDLQSLLANIVDPSSVIRREFLSYVITTNAGINYTGLIVEQDGSSITLVDAKNQRTRIDRQQIDEMSESTTSLMPEKLLEQLSPQELRDLLAYLQGPRLPLPSGSEK